MADMLSTTISYIPASLLGLLIDQETPPHEPTRHVFEAAVLFADVSGFTPLTEALAKKGDEGPEEITRLLNRYFGRMITLLESEGGDVVKFSGDALTVLFDASDEPLSKAVRRAQQAAHAMQEVMQELAPVQTSVGPVELALKVGIGGGEVLALQVGGVFRRWEYVITGEGLRQAAEAEGVTARGGVTLSPQMEVIAHPDPLPPRALCRMPLRGREDLPLVETRLRRFLPGAVRSWMVDEELHDWLAVLRPMSVLFIGVAGIHYESEEGLLQSHQFLRSAQETIYRYQGSINKLAVDDKGTIFLVLFGAPPFAHADDPLRAVRCALDLAEAAKAQGLVLRTGITTGRVFAGPVGSDLRREYTVMGDAVNLAARLMGKAAAHHALCDMDTMMATQSLVEFEALAPVLLKGKSNPTPVFEPQRLRIAAGQSSDDDLMIGRVDELSRLVNVALETQAGESRLVLLRGDAGIGKTMLLRALREQAQGLGLLCLDGAGQSLEQLTGYWAWRKILFQLFGLRDIEGEEAAQHVSAVMKEHLPDLELAPLLNDILDLSLPENDITRSLEPSIRQESLRGLIVNLLTHWAEEVQPVCLLVENLQWLDSLSWELLLHVCRALKAADLPLFVAMSSRPMGANDFSAPQMESLQSIEGLQEMEIGLLSSEDILALISARLKCSPSHLPETLEDFVYKRSDGNPLFACELLDFLLRKGLLNQRLDSTGAGYAFASNASQMERLPDSLEGLLLARIDQLPPATQLVLKVASVVGRRFSFGPLLSLLRGHAQVSERELHEQLSSLQQQGLTVPEISDELLVYLFKNLATQEVTYRSLLYQQRRELHRTFAQWLEDSIPDGEQIPDHYLPLLCHHWRHADEPQKELHFTHKAGQSAAKAYANTEAIERYSRALELAPAEGLALKIQLHLEREALYNRLGQREQQRKDLDALGQLQPHMSPSQRSLFRLREATYAESISDFEAAREQAQQAAQLARQQGDAATESQATYSTASALLKLGHMAEAEAQFQSARQLAAAHDAAQVEASALRMLGNCKAMAGDFHAALGLFEQALSIHERLEDHANAIKARNNIGLVHQQFGATDQALEAFEAAYFEAHEIGCPPLESLVSGNLATAYIEMGQYAQAEDLLLQALRISHAIDSPADIGFNSLFFGENYMRLGEYSQAIERFEDALERSVAMGHRYMEGYAHLLLAEAHTLHHHGPQAHHHCQAALEIAEAIQQPAIEVDARLLLGLLATQEGHFEAGHSAFERAQNLFAELDLPNRSIEAQAGHIRLMLREPQDRQTAILEHLESILAFLEDKGIQGVREPFWVWHTCLQLLQRLGDPRFSPLLQTAHEQLSSRAHGLTPEQRQRYLDIPHHAALLQMQAETQR